MTYTSQIEHTQRERENKMTTLQQAKDCSYFTYYLNKEWDTIATREEFERDTIQENLECAQVETAEELFDIELEQGIYEEII